MKKIDFVIEEKFDCLIGVEIEYLPNQLIRLNNENIDYSINYLIEVTIDQFFKPILLSIEQSIVELMQKLIM